MAALLHSAWTYASACIMLVLVALVVTFPRVARLQNKVGTNSVLELRIFFTRMLQNVEPLFSVLEESRTIPTNIFAIFPWKKLRKIHQRTSGGAQGDILVSERKSTSLQQVA